MDRDEPIDLIAYWHLLVRRKRFVFVFTTLFMVGSIVYSLVLPNFYQAVATLAITGGGSSGAMSSSALSAVGGLLMGLPSSSGSGDRLRLYLKSQVLAEKLVRKYDLTKTLFRNQWDEKGGKWKTDDPREIPTAESAADRVRSMIDIEQEGVAVYIKAVDRDPRLVTEIVNRYVETLAEFVNENAITSAKRQRLFVQSQLERNKIEYLESGRELSRLESDGKVSSVSSSLDVTVSVESPLPPSILYPTADRAQEKGFSNGSAGVPGLPEAFADADRKIETLQNQAKDLDQKLETLKVVKDVPISVYLQHLLLRRKVLGQVNILLTEQLEMAKMDEAKEALSFQVIDWARPPERPFKPNRRTIVVLSILVSFLLAVILVFFIDYLEKAGVAIPLKRWL